MKSAHATVRHPLTGKKVRFRRPTQPRLERCLHVVEEVRDLLAAKHISDDEADRRIRRLQHGVDKTKLERAAQSYAARADLSDNTRRAVATFLSSPGAELVGEDLNALDVNRIKEWLSHLRARQVADGTISCYWRLLRAIVMHAVDRGLVGRLPWGDFRPRLSRERARERENCDSPEQLARVLYAAREIDREENFARELEIKLVIAVAFGFRQGELAGLRWQDVDARELVVTVARQYAGARLKMRRPAKRLAGVREVFSLLERYRLRLEARRLYAPDGPVFPSVKHSARGTPRPYVKGEVLARRAVRAVIERAGLPNKGAWSAHSFRDTFAKLESIGHRGDLGATADRTRHRSLSSLARYLRSVRRGLVPPGFELPTLDGAEPRSLLASGDGKRLDS